jgi:hypothetical protein
VLKKLVRNMRDAVIQRLPLRTAISLEFFMYHGRFPRLDRPQTFNEKIASRKLYDRDSRLPRLADKLLVKDYVAEKLGKEWVIPTLWSGDRLPSRNERHWPVPYVLKARHGSGWNFFVRSEEEQDWTVMEEVAQEWLGKAYGRPSREWLYTQIRPGLLVEPYLGTGEIAPPDYKFYVFGGRTAYIQVDLGRMQIHRQLFYDLNWRRQRFEYVCPWTDEEVSPPACLRAMIEGANLLGSALPFVRVDMYVVKDKPLFGEMTFYPNSGRFAFKPRSAEMELGRLWPEQVR